MKEKFKVWTRYRPGHVSSDYTEIYMALIFLGESPSSEPREVLPLEELGQLGLRSNHQLRSKIWAGKSSMTVDLTSFRRQIHSSNSIQKNGLVH